MAFCQAEGIVLEVRCCFALKTVHSGRLIALLPFPSLVGGDIRLGPACPPPLQAYSPLAKAQKLADPTVAGIAQRLGVTPAQVLIRCVKNGGGEGDTARQGGALVVKAGHMECLPHGHSVPQRGD